MVTTCLSLDVTECSHTLCADAFLIRCLPVWLSTGHFHGPHPVPVPRGLPCATFLNLTHTMWESKLKTGKAKPEI